MTPLLQRVADLLDDARHVVVVTSAGDEAPGGHAVTEALAAPGREVRVVVHDGGAAPLHARLSGHGHADVLVDLARGPGVAHRLAVLAAHVRRGGLVVVAAPGRAEARARLQALLDDLRSLRAAGTDPPARRRDTRSAAERDRHALATTLAPTGADATARDVGPDDLVTLRVEVATWSRVHESRADALLRSAPGLGEVVVTRPSVPHPPSAPVTSSWTDEPELPTDDAPPLSLRSWHDAVVSASLVAHTRDLVLPQAFRNPLRERPTTPALTDWSRWSVRVPAELDDAPPDHLPGTWFHADNVLRGHFGHALTEQLSQLWAWPEVLARHPDAGVLVTTRDSALAGWELDLLEAGGIPRDRVHGAPRPVRVDRLLAATPGYVIGRRVHPAVRATYAAVGDALEARSTLTDTPVRLFVVRSHPKRRCHEADAVEALAVEHGFTLVAPEQHPLPDQVAMARRARVVAGWAGSGMFHLLLGGPPRRVVVLAHTGYHASNEKAAAALWGHPTTLVRGVPDTASTASTASGTVPPEPMHADFHLDLDGPAGPLLRDALAAPA